MYKKIKKNLKSFVCASLFHRPILCSDADNHSRQHEPDEMRWKNCKVSYFMIGGSTSRKPELLCWRIKAKPAWSWNSCTSSYELGNPASTGVFTSNQQAAGSRSQFLKKKTLQYFESNWNRFGKICNISEKLLICSHTNLFI